MHLYVNRYKVIKWQLIDVFIYKIFILKKELCIGKINLIEIIKRANLDCKY